jgi:hypothetical protein
VYWAELLRLTEEEITQTRTVEELKAEIEQRLGELARTLRLWSRIEVVAAVIIPLTPLTMAGYFSNWTPLRSLLKRKLLITGVCRMT